MALESLPEWSRMALQGITFWVGHRRCLYSHYPLGESAFVAELCNLIFAHLPKNKILKCEVMYRDLVGTNELPTIFGRRARADIVVFDKPTKEEKARGEDPVPSFIIEVKRGAAPKKEIDSDLERLAAIAKLMPNCRTMLFLVCEAERPKRFVSSEGTSILGPKQIAKDSGSYRVRRTFKAAHAYKNKETAQYASLIEVYPAKSKRKSAPKKEA